MNYIKICLAAACILWLCGPLSVALAGSVTQPGSTLGTAPGAPLPEGFYFSNTADWGFRDPSTRLFVDHPVYTWSTPWMILGARFHVLAETALDANETGGRHAGGFYNRCSPGSWLGISGTDSDSATRLAPISMSTRNSRGAPPRSLSASR